MGEENNPLWGTATIFINGEKLGVLEAESKTITMENKQFNEGDKVLLNGNTENIYVISKVIHNYRGQGGCRYHLRKENEEYGSNLSFVRGSKLSAYEGEHRNVKIGDWLRCTTTNKVFKLYAVDYSESLRCFVVGDKDAFVTHTFEPYSPKEGEFTLVQFDDNADRGRNAILNVKKWGDLVYDSASIFIKDNVCFCNSGSEFAFLGDISYFRPATEEEKQTLIKAVEDKFSKTYCEKTKEWVDMKEKSDVKADKVEQGTMPFFTNIGLGRIDLTELQRIAELSGWVKPNDARFRQITEANKEVIELLVKVGVLQDPTNPSDVYSYNVGKSDYAKKSPIQPWMMWQLWDWLTPWDCDIIKRLYRDKEGTSRIEDYNKIIHICKERIRQLNEEK